MELNFCTFNCCSLKKNINLIREIASLNFSIIFLQETLITDDNIRLLDFIDETYSGLGVGAIFSDKSIATSAGRPMGGLACIYKNNLNVKCLYSADDIIVISVNMNNMIIVFVNVYIRSDLGDPYTQAEYINNLFKIEAIVNDINYDSIYVVGDWNADPYFGRAWENLTAFIQRNNFTCIDTNSLPSDTFTYISNSTGYVKWLDHILGWSLNNCDVTEVSVLSEFIGSDHLPLKCTIKLPENSVFTNPNKVSESSRYYIDWNNLSQSDIKEIDINTQDMLLRDVLTSQCVTCSDFSCSRKECIDSIDKFYSRLVNSVTIATNYMVKVYHKVSKYKIIPGWNRNVKGKYNAFRDAYKDWLSSGKIINHHTYFKMVELRTVFKTALKTCKNNRNNEELLSIQEKFQNRNMKKFWSEVSKRRGGQSVPNNIDGFSNSSDILNVFSCSLFQNDNYVPDNEALFIHNKSRFNTAISSHTFREHVKNLNKGCGHDLLHSDLLCNASDDFVDILVFFINSCFQHSYFPKDLLKGDISPIIKNKKGNACDSKNYRPIMQSSNLLKIIELHILSILEEKVNLKSNQFGFTKNHSTTDTCFLLKEIIGCSIKKKGKVYANFVDFSKAFDNIKHFLLINKLIEKEVPGDLTKLIECYLYNQSARVKWNHTYGDYKPIKLGVRQGGILSPFLFKLYIDVIIDKLSKLDHGCKFGLSKINILAYADDMVIMASSRYGLNCLYLEFLKLINEHNLKININKSKIMIFTNNRKYISETKLKLGDDDFEVVPYFNYLGHFISFNLDDSIDVKQKLNSFYIKFNSTFRNFRDLCLDGQLFLFNSFALPSYGLQLWNSSNIIKKSIFKTFSVSYSNSLKLMVGCPRYSSSHLTAEVCNLLLLEHLVGKIQIKYLFRIKNHMNPIFNLNRTYLKNGHFFRHVYNLFKNKYNISLYNNPLDSIISRILFVQKHERNGQLCHFFNE